MTEHRLLSRYSLFRWLVILLTICGLFCVYTNVSLADTPSAEEPGLETPVTPEAPATQAQEDASDEGDEIAAPLGDTVSESKPTTGTVTPGTPATLTQEDESDEEDETAAPLGDTVSEGTPTTETVVTEAPATLTQEDAGGEGDEIVAPLGDMVSEGTPTTETVTPEVPATLTEEKLIEEPTADPPPAGPMMMMRLNNSNEEEEQEEEEETPEPYAAPVGSAYIKEIGADIAYESDANQNAIQNAIANALVQAKRETETKTATIVVADGVYEGGIDLTLAEDGTLRGALLDLLGVENIPKDGYGDLTLRIVAHDALDENGNPTANSLGNVVVKGDIEISGINVLLAGIYLSLRETIKASDTASITYYGTVKDDELTVDVSDVSASGDVDSVAVYGGDGNDRIDVQVAPAPNDSVPALSTTVYATIGALADAVYEADDKAVDIAAAAPDVQSGYDALKTFIHDRVADKLKETVTPLGVTVDGGTGNDILSVKLINSTEFSFSLDEADTFQDLFGIRLDFNKVILNVLGGTGSDTMTYEGGTSAVLSRWLTLTMIDFVSDAIDAVDASMRYAPELKLSGGEDDDVLTVDTTAAFATIPGTVVTTEGGGGYDRLHLTGKLDARDGSDRIAYDDGARTYSVDALAQMTIIGIPFNFYRSFAVMQGADVETVTDTLENKHVYEPISGMRDFTDILIDVEDYENAFERDASAFSSPLRLASLVINADEDQLLTIGNINAPNLNVVINALKVIFTGTVNCLNLLINAFTEDVTLAELEINVIEDDFDDENEIALNFGLYDAKAAVGVTFGESSTINASGVVDVFAGTSQNKAFIPGTGDDDLDANFFTFKLSDTGVLVAGAVNAAGAVRIQTDVKIELDLENGALSVVIPVAVGAADAVNHISVAGDNAKIASAGGGVLLFARTNVKLTANACAGAVPITVGLTVAIVDTSVTVGGITGDATPAPIAGSVHAAYGVCMEASACTSATSTTAGKPTNEIKDKPKSGGFFSVNVIKQNVRAAVLGEGTVSSGTVAAGNGGIQILSTSITDAQNKAISIPQSSEAEELGIFTAFGLVQKLMEKAAGLGKSVAAINNIIQKIDPNQMNTITSLVFGPVLEENTAPTKQIMGALSFIFLENTNEALIDTEGAVTANGDPIRLRAYATSYADARADASLYKSDLSITEGSAEKAFGIGLGILLYAHDNRAAIEHGAIKSSGLAVMADSGHSATRLVVKSGHMPADTDIGVGGAVAIQIAEQNTEAILKKSASYTLTGGGVAVTARGAGGYVTVADASGKRKTPQVQILFLTLNLKDEKLGGTGIGAGIAVAVTDVQMRAVIEDETAFNDSGITALENVSVSASYSGNDRTHAAAGAKGGTSAVPVLALQISGVSVEACIGTGSGTLTTSGNIRVQSALQMERTMVADANAVGSGVGFGAAVGVAVLSDASSATIKRSAKGRNIYVEAGSVSRLSNKVLAGVKGAKPKSGTDTQDHNNNSTQDEIDNELKNNRNQDKNDQNNTDDDGEADKLLTKLLSAGASLVLKLRSTNIGAVNILLGAPPPKAQTSEGSVSIAAGFAVNIHSNFAEAIIATGTTITAEATGGEGGEVLVKSLNDTDASAQGSASAVNSTTGVGVGVALNKVEYRNIAWMLASNVTAKKLTVTADIADAADKRTVEEIVLSIITYLAKDPEKMEGFINLVSGEDGRSIDEIVAEAKEKLPPEQQNLSDAEIKARLLMELANQLVDGNTAELAGSIIGELVSGIISEFFDILGSETFWMSVLTGQGSELSDFFDEIALGSKVVSTRLEAAIARALAIQFGSADEMDGVGHKFSTQAISGVGASNIGVAGAAGVALIDGNTEASIGANATIAVSGDVLVSAESAQKGYTTASASADKKGQAVKKKENAGSSVGIGASSAVADIVMRVFAGIHESGIVNAGTLAIISKGYSDADTIAIAGSDPIARRESPEVPPAVIGTDNQYSNNVSTKDIAVDASGALTMLSNDVQAIVKPGVQVTVGAGDTVETYVVTGKNGDTPVYEKVSFYLLAQQTGKTRTEASGFASGNSTAVGACAAVNLAESLVTADFSGIGVVGGVARLAATSYDEDEVDALATVVGASLDRYLDKLRKLLGILSLGSGPDSGALNRMIGDKLNTFVSDTTGGNSILSLIPGVSLATNALQALGLTMPETGDSNVTDKLANTDVPQLSTPETENQKQSINVAAAVGVNITKHNTLVNMPGSLKARSAALESANSENFFTNGSGATVTVFDTNQNNISVGVAVARNRNRSEVAVAGTLLARGTNGTDADANGDIGIASVVTQNMDGVYRGLLGAQAVAGSVSGTGGKIGAAGAVAVMINDSAAIATLGGTAKGGSVGLFATDKSKLAVRAGSVMASSGASVGMGASFALVYANNLVKASVSENANVTAASLHVSAKRLPVTDEDYELPFSRATLLTVDVTEPSKKGIVNLTTTEGAEGKYSVEITLDTRDLLSTLNFLNFLSSVNYYLESVAGMLNMGASSLALTGAASMLYNKSVTEALIADGARITLTGDLAVLATAETNTRIIGGSLTAGTSTTAIGLNAAGIYQEDTIAARIGRSALITNVGNLSISAEDKSNAMIITAAAALTTGSTGVGGGLNAALLNGSVLAELGDTSEVTASGSVQVKAMSTAELLHIAASAAGSGGVAAGGTLAFTMTGRSVLARVGNSASVRAASVQVEAVNNEDMSLYLASLSGSTGGVGVAGTVGVLLTESSAIAEVGRGAGITATAGDILIAATANVRERILLAAASGTFGSAAAGAAVTVGIFDNLVSARVGDGANLTSERGSVITRADVVNDSLILTVAGGAAATTAISGAIPVIVSGSQALATVGSGAILYAYDTVAVLAAADEELVIAAGSLSGSGTVGVGATLSTLVGASTVLASIGDDCNITGKALVADGGVELSNREEKRRGVVVSAFSAMRLLLASVSGAASGTAAVAGVVNTLVMENDVQARIGKHVALNQTGVARNADGAITAGTDDTSGDQTQEIYVAADDDSHLYHFGGGLSVAGTVGVGVATVVSVYDKTVRAAIGGGGLAFAKGNVTISAHSNDEQMLIALALGVAASAAVSPGASVLAFDSEVSASLGGTVTANGTIRVTADSQTTLSVFAAAAAASGVAVGGVAAVVCVSGITTAEVLAHATLTAAAVLVSAHSTEHVTSSAGGFAVAGTAAVSGTVVVAIARVTTTASVGAGAAITANGVTDGGISVTAMDDFTILGVAATLGASGTAAVGITAQVVVTHNTITASVGDGATLASQHGDVFVTAAANRTIRLYAGAVSAGVTAGVDTTIMAAVIGGKLSQDTADPLKSGFDADAFLTDAFGKANDRAAGKAPTDLSALLFGDGTKQSDINLTDIDVTDGYRVSELDDNTFDDGGATARGENAALDESTNKGLNDAANIGNARPTYDPKDSVIATIGSNAVINAGSDVTVSANDTLTIDLITGTIAAGGYAGVGAGVAVAVLYANVFADVGANTHVSAAGTITVSAASTSAEQQTPNGFGAPTNGQPDAEKDYIGEIGKSTIRALSISGGGALVSAQAAVAAITLSASVRATFGGRAIHGAALSVNAVSAYDNLSVATLAASAGAVAVGASVALILNDTVMEAAIGGASDISGIGSIAVSSNAVVSAISAAMAFAVGGVAVNGAVALVIDRRNIETYIGRGVTVTGADRVSVLSTVDTEAKAVILGAALSSGVSVNVAAAVVILSAVVLTHVGDTPGGFTENSFASGAGGCVDTGALTVTSDVNADGKALVANLTAGSAAIGGNVLLIFNDAAVRTGLFRATVRATGNVTVGALMNASTDATLAAAAVGTAAVGASAAYVRLSCDNRAVLDTTTVIAANLYVYAGGEDTPNVFAATANGLSANAGLIAVGLNAAIADNQSINQAAITGNGTVEIFGTLDIYANGVATAKAQVTGLSVGGLRILASFALAVNRASEAALADGGAVRAGALSVQSVINHTPLSSASDATTAKLVTGGGALANVAASCAIAYGRTSSIAQVSATCVTVTGEGNVTVKAGGNMGVRADIENLAGVNGVAAGVMAGLAFAQGLFMATIDLPAGAMMTAGNVTVETEYNARAGTFVQPSSGGAFGANVTVIGLQINLAIAKITTEAIASVTGAGSIDATGNVEIASTGETEAMSTIPDAAIRASGASIVANFVLAALCAKQSAYAGGVSIRAASLTVTSVLNGAGTPVLARTGSSGREDGNVKLAGASVTANTAIALAGFTNAAYLAGTGVDLNGALLVHANSRANTAAEVTTGMDISLLGVRLMMTIARSTAVNLAYIEVLAARPITADSIAILSVFDNETMAAVQPAGGLSSSISMGELSANVATADAAMQATSYLSGEGTIRTIGAITVRTTGEVNVEAIGKTARITASGLMVAVNVVKATNRIAQNAYITGTLLIDADGAITVESVTGSSSVKAETGGSAGCATDEDGVGAFTLTLVGATVNSAEALSAMIHSAYINNAGSIAAAGAVNVQAQGASVVNSAAWASSGITIALATIGSLSATTRVCDSVYAGIRGGSVTAVGDVTVHAKNDVRADASVQVPTVFAGVNVKAATVLTEIGSFRSTGVNAEEQTWSRPSLLGHHTVRSEIADSARVTSLGGSILVHAENIVAAWSAFVAGTSFVLAGLTYTRLPVQGAYMTVAEVGYGVNLTAAGDVTVLAEDDVTQKAVLYVSAIGVLVGSYLVTELVVAEAVHAVIGDFVTIVAGGSITVQSLSGITAQSGIVCDSVGLLSGTFLRSVVALTYRELTVTIGERTVLNAAGNICVLAGSKTPVATLSAYTQDGMYTVANRISNVAGALAGATSVGVLTINNTDANIFMGGNNHETLLQAGGDILIRAWNDLYAVTQCRMDNSGLSAGIELKSAASVTLRASVDIGRSSADYNDAMQAWVPTYGQCVTVSGHNVTIQAAQGLVFILTQNLFDAESTGFGSFNVRSATEMHQPVCEVNLNNAQLSAKDTLFILASLQPEKTALDGTNVQSGVNAATSIHVASGVGKYVGYSRVTATRYTPVVVVDEALNAAVRVSGLAVLAAGKDITLSSLNAPSDNYRSSATFYGALGNPQGYNEYEIYTVSHTLVHGGAKFYIGTALGGANVLVDENGHVTASGVSAVKNGNTVIISGANGAVGGGGNGTIHIIGGWLNGNTVYTGGVNAAGGLTVNNFSQLELLFDGVSFTGGSSTGSSAVTVTYAGPADRKACIVIRTRRFNANGDIMGDVSAPYNFGPEQSMAEGDGFIIETESIEIPGSEMSSGLNVYNFKGGDVTFAGVNDIGNAPVELVWLGEATGQLIARSATIDINGTATLVAPLWTTGLTVSGNVDIGSESAPFTVYLRNPASGVYHDAASLSADVTGDLYIKLSQIGVETLIESVGTSTADFNQPLRIGKVIAGGAHSLIIEYARRFYRKGNGSDWAAVVLLDAENQYEAGYALGPLHTKYAPVYAETILTGSSVTIESAYKTLLVDHLGVSAASGNAVFTGMTAIGVWSSCRITAAGNVAAGGVSLIGKSWVTTNALHIAAGGGITLDSVDAQLNGSLVLRAGGNITVAGWLEATAILRTWRYLQAAISMRRTPGSRCVRAC